MTSASPSPAVRRSSVALEAVYEAFAAPAPDRIEGCPCCTAKRGVDVLLTTPLRVLSGRQLWSYVSGAFLTIGAVADFRYLLPRILDISINDPGAVNDAEIVLGKLALAGWRSWREDEQRVLEELVDAWLERALERDVEAAEEGFIGCEAESVLCGAARAGIPLDRWLTRLHDRDAAPVLADLRQRFPADLSAFWDDSPEGLRQLSLIFGEGEA